MSDNELNNNLNVSVNQPNYSREIDMLFRLSHEIRYMYESDFIDDYASSISSDDDDDSQLINDSFYQEDAYKKVFNLENHKHLLKHACYKMDKYKNTSCPIYMVDFKDDDEIVELPCGHCFIPQAIYQWLEKQSHCCPYCRYELPSKEIKIDAVPDPPAPVYPNRPLNVFETANIQNNNVLLEMIIDIINNNNF